MQKINYSKNCNKTTLLTRLFNEGFRKAGLLFAALLLVLSAANPTYAAVEGFVTKKSNGNYFQYSYNELIDSYALNLLGMPNGLYEDFTKNKPLAFLSSSGKYIDYEDVINSYAAALILKQPFSLKNYTNSSQAKPIVMPPAIIKVTLNSGKLVREPLTLNRSEGSQTAAQPEAPAKPKLPEKQATATPITGNALVSLARAQQWAAERGALQSFIDIAPLYWEYGLKSGIRPEVLYAQAAIETGFGRYGGQVPPDYNNLAGIKIGSSSGDKPEDHEQFATPADGVRAHFNHIAAYIGLKPLGEPHSRYFVVTRLTWAGTVKLVEELSGKWAPSATYHERIVAMLEEMKR